jgi:biotin carboxyl carrier protein
VTDQPTPRSAQELRAGTARLKISRDGIPQDQGRWRRVAEFQRRLAAAPDLAALGFMLVNETWRVTRHRQAVLWRIGRDGRPRPVIVSGQSRLASDTPAVQWLHQLGRHLLPSLQDGAVRDLDDELPALPPALAVDRQAFLPGVVRVVPIAAAGGRPRGLLALAFDAPPNAEALSQLAALQPVWDTAWVAAEAAAQARRSRSGPARSGWPLAGWLLALAAVLAMALPVHLSVLAPADVVALDAEAVAAPMDGVVQRFLVEPNQAVGRDDPLFTLDDTTLRNRQAVAAQQLQVARAEVLAATQRAFTQDASRAELAALQGRVAEREAELAWVDEQLARVQVRAPVDGVVLYSDPNDWVGRPVSTGERVALVGDPASAGVLVWLSVNDALDIQPGASLRLFLPTEPLAPRDARLIMTSYQAVTSPDGIASYRLRARFDPPGDRPAPRIGLRGTAKLIGERVPLGYLLFRRPIAALRAWTGW